MVWSLDAFDEVEEGPTGHRAYDMSVQVKWCSDFVRSRLGVRPFGAEGRRDGIFCGYLELPLEI